jgi:hypothetical protein
MALNVNELVAKHRRKLIEKEGNCGALCGQMWDLIGAYYLNELSSSTTITIIMIGFVFFPPLHPSPLSFVFIHSFHCGSSRKYSYYSYPLYNQSKQMCPF